MTRVWMLLGLLLLLSPSWAGAQDMGSGSVDLEGLSVSRSTQQAKLMSERKALLQSAGPVDPDTYVLGPGDLMGMEILGAVSISAEDVIGADGSITFPQIGTLWLGGLTLTEARGRVGQKGKGLLKGVQAELLLKAMRTFKVLVTGRVNTPGSYLATPHTRVSEILAAASGFAGSANVRDIAVTRGDSTRLSVDLLPFLLRGDLEHNVRLLDGDVIYVEPRLDVVEFSGALVHAGTYDWKEGDDLATFLDLLILQPRADRGEALIQRFTDAVRWDTLAVDLGPVLSGASTVSLRPGDRVMIKEIGDWHPEATAEVRGAVASPGPIPVERGRLTVAEAVLRAGGADADAVLDRVILGRSFRPDSTWLTDPSGTRNYVESLTGQTLQERVVDLTAGDGPLVESGDVITVPRAEGWVQILGQVKRPGFYDYREGWKTGDYIDAAGGFAKLADKSKTRVSRGRFGDVGYAKDIKVPSSGDVIWVPEKGATTWWNVTKDVLTISSQAAALYLVVREAAR